jgi:hypothetical protein
MGVVGHGIDSLRRGSWSHYAMVMLATVWPVGWLASWNLLVVMG